MRAIIRIHAREVDAIDDLDTLNTMLTGETDPDKISNLSFRIAELMGQDPAPTPRTSAGEADA